MICKIPGCEEPTTCTVEINVAEPPYRVDAEFCQAHGEKMGRILGREVKPK